MALKTDAAASPAGCRGAEPAAVPRRARPRPGAAARVTGAKSRAATEGKAHIRVFPRETARQ